MVIFIDEDTLDHKDPDELKGEEIDYEEKRV